MNNIDDVHYTVGEVADLFGVTVRTLHHWEEKGLLVPSWRSWSNYRLYTAEDCMRVQQILVYRATGMTLTDIKHVLEKGATDVEHLQRQRQVLKEKQAQLESMLEALDTLLEDAMTDKKLTTEEIGAIVGDANFAAHQAEAEDRYHHTDDWEISRERTAAWSKVDWESQVSAMREIDAALADAVRAGLSPDSAEAQELVARHRAVLGKFFPVTPAKHFLISRGYVADDRFLSHYENQAPGLAQWLADAIEAAARAAGVDTNNPEWI